MKYIKNLLVPLLIVLTVSACSIKGHKYKANFDSVNILKDNNLKFMNVQRQMVKEKKEESISLRAANMISPYGGSFSEYLEESLEEELKEAALYDNSSDIHISTLLLKNDVSISGFSIGEADLSAKFIVMKNNEKLYEKVHTIHHEWDSSFIGQIAIENALENYPIAIQKLIDSFLLDKNFMEKVK